MFGSDPKPKRQSLGFSLIELMVSLVFTAILMAGMFKIFATTTSTFAANTETINIQRKARWGLAMLQEEVLQAGYLMPSRIVGEISTSGSGQPPFLMQTTGYIPTDATDAVDELQMVMDIPLNVQGTLSSAVAVGDKKLTVNIPSGAANIKPDDLIFMLDSAWEALRVSGSDPLTGVDLTIPVEGDPSKLLDQYGNPVAPLVHASFEKAHLVGAQFTVIRPLQVVRYTVVPRANDPSDSTKLVPCLVRQARPLTEDPLAPWTLDPATPAADEQVLLENVVGFKVDWSLDAGRTWLKKDVINDVNANWETVQKTLNTYLTGLDPAEHPFTSQAKGAYNPADPFWMNYVPVLVRVDLFIRSQMQRTEFNPASTAAAPQAAYRTRQETLFLTPRNFSLGKP